MTLILSLTVASAVGTLLGNVILFWGIGMMAARKEKQQQAELHKLQQSYIEMAERERERLERYARMEG